MADENKAQGGANPALADGNKSPNKEKKSSSKLKEATHLEEGTVIGIARQDAQGGKTDNYMWVEGTGESRHMPKGKKFEVQRQHGEKLISKGAAKETSAPQKPVAKPLKKKSEDEDDED